MTVPAGATTVPLTTSPATSTNGANALALLKPVRAALPTAIHGGTYQVKAGDTVSHIALRTGTSVQAIIELNGLNRAGLIRVGQVLRLPGASVNTSASTARPASSSATSSRTHTVRAGDTVSALAARYGTTVQAIISANNLNSRALIIVGQRLTIPGTSSGSSNSGSSNSGSSNSNSGSNNSGSNSSGTSNRSVTHTVRAGDTVSALAARYGTTVQAIVSANNLNSSALIIVGQRLTIPATVTPVSNNPGGNNSGGGNNDQLVGDSFLGRTYPADVVAAANQNKATLLAMDVPSRDQMQAMVRSVALEMGVDPALAQAIAYQESGFDARAVSPANAVGVMQVIPSSGEWASNLVGRRLNLLDPHDNVVAGVAILRQLMRSAPDFDTAVAGYYQGLAGVLRDGMFPDTRNYVAGINRLMDRFS